MLSFDIETDAKSERLLAISPLFSTGVDEVLIVDGSGRPVPSAPPAAPMSAPPSRTFAARVAALDPDVLTGWNIVDFDLRACSTRSRRAAESPAAPWPGARHRAHPQSRRLFRRWSGGAPGNASCSTASISCAEKFVRMDDYSLDAVAQQVLGEGKAVAGDARDRIAEIIHNYKHDLAAFALYARTDRASPYPVVSKLRLIRGSPFALDQLTGMTPDRVAASIASFDFPVPIGARAHPHRRPERARRRFACTSRSRADVLEPVAGLHRNVWVFDFQSLYPSIIRTFNIDPLSYVPAATPEAGLSAPDRAFRRAPAILPRLLDRIPAARAAKQRRDETAAHAIKI